MTRDIKRLDQLLQMGRCCSAALVQLALEMKGEENPALIEAAAGLCGGVRSGLLCGALTGGALMLGILAPDLAGTDLVPELTEWFEDVCSEYGGMNCADIVGDSPINRKLRCPGLVEETYRQCCDILESYGYEFDE